MADLDPRTIAASAGPAWAASWTDVVDRQVRQGLADIDGGSGMAVVALGSYGRGQLCPGSDIDLLLLHDGWPRQDLEAVVRAICYPLWDAGLTVGHAVRSSKDAVKAAGERLDTATALLQRRLVAGDQGLLDDLAARTSRWLRRNGDGMIRTLGRSDHQRRASAGSHPGMLEPELKEGAGGLRDLHSLEWAAAALLGSPGLAPLVGARYLGAADHRDLVDAQTTLLRTRCALHLVHLEGSRGAQGDPDRLRLDLQDEVAALLGTDADALLRTVGLAMRVIAHVHGRTWPLLEADAGGGRGSSRRAPEPLGDGLGLRDGLIEIDAQRPTADEPGVALRAMAVAAAHRAHFGRVTAERLRRELRARTPLDWDAQAREALLDVLRAGVDALPVLADADHLGVLEAYLPEWGRVRGRPQRNPFHRFDLDTHAFQTVAWLVAIGGGAVSEHHTDLWRGLDDADAVLLAACFHDIGKAWPGDHSIAGARVVRRWMRQMGFAEARIERVALLVREHLLLPDVATRRDLDDEREIAAVADRLGAIDVLDGLYLLSMADARATGPSAHSPWKDGLLTQLHDRVRRHLSGTWPEPHVSVERIVSHATDLLPGGDVGEVELLVEGAPERYLAAADARQLAEHARLLRLVPPGGEARACVRPGPADGTSILSVVASDQRGLFADCAGVLAGHGAEVLDARAFTRSDGVALDWFVVGADRDVDWDRLVDDLGAATAGELEVAELVARRERRRGRRASRLEALVGVHVAFEADDELWRIEVRGPDGPGVLFRLARALDEAGLDVTGARATTLGPELRDVFFVRIGQRPPDTHALEARLREAVGISR